jgi:hypothetical protein
MKKIILLISFALFMVSCHKESEAFKKMSTEYYTNCIALYNTTTLIYPRNNYGIIYLDKYIVIMNDAWSIFSRNDTILDKLNNLHENEEEVKKLSELNSSIKNIWEDLERLSIGFYGNDESINNDIIRCQKIMRELKYNVEYNPLIVDEISNRLENKYKRNLKK